MSDKPESAAGVSSPQAPCSPGFWWARIGSYKWFNVLVEVYGDAPFLRLRGWDVANQRLVVLESWNIEQWGPRIEQPETENAAPQTRREAP